ncbi:MAG TPA: hypothetical protein VFB14_19515 [Bryobacteraceae bacterium]|jgi:hypothetical protein|nr:hypothetical protein [Bryobacteraceae bacterium]
MEIETAMGEIRDMLAHTLQEERAYRLLQAWLVILREAYHADRKQFSDQQIEYLKQVRALAIHLRRFIELQEELAGPIGWDEYNQGIQDLTLLEINLAEIAVSKRVKKEKRQLIERQREVMDFEQSKGRAKLTNRILTLEENAGACPKNKNHRLQIRQGKNGYFWGCSAFPSCCWHTQPLTPSELAQLEI